MTTALTLIHFPVRMLVTSLLLLELHKVDRPSVTCFSEFPFCWSPTYLHISQTPPTVQPTGITEPYLKLKSGQAGIYKHIKIKNEHLKKT